MTFSVLLGDGTSLVAASASCAPAVGGVVTHVRDGVGAAVTQARGQRTMGVEILDGLARQRTPTAAVTAAVRRAGHVAARQAAAVSLDGRGAIVTGSEVLPTVAEVVGDGWVVCGNLLASAAVGTAMAEVLEAGGSGRGPVSLALEALRSAQQAGGDARGQMSAALRAHGTGLDPRLPGIEVDLDARIDRSERPLADLEDACATMVAYERVAALADGRLAIDSSTARHVLDELTDAGPDASAAVLFCRRVIADRLGQKAEGESLARGVVRRRPGPGASEATVNRLFGTG